MDLAARAPDPPRHPQARQLAAAVQVRPRRRLGLRRQPDRLRRSSSSPADLHHIAAAVGAFCVAVTNNFFWNRHWTFRAGDGHAGFQAARFFAVSVVGARLQPRRARAARLRVRRRRAAGPGDRGRLRDAGQLHRQQAVDLRLSRRARALARRARAALAGGARPPGTRRVDRARRRRPRSSRSPPRRRSSTPTTSPVVEEQTERYGRLETRVQAKRPATGRSASRRATTRSRR